MWGSQEFSDFHKMYRHDHFLRSTKTVFDKIYIYILSHASMIYRLTTSQSLSSKKCETSKYSC